MKYRKAQQSKLDDYVHKKTKGRSLQHFSKVYQETQDQDQTVELISFTGVEPNVVRRSKKKQYRVEICCTPFLLIGPTDIITYQTELFPQFEKLEQQYSAHKALNFIHNNIEKNHISNISNLQLLIEDDQFWSLILPKIISFTLENIQALSSKVRLLVASQSHTVDLSRKDILLIMSSMFLGIIPEQFFQSQPHFGHLFNQNEHDKDGGRKNRLKLQKIKCLMSYFKTSITQEAIWNEQVRFCRFCQKQRRNFDAPTLKLRKVKVVSFMEGSINDYYCDAAIVSESDKTKIGVNALRNGCSQSDILFMLFPQTIVAKLLCEELNQNEAVTVQCAKKYSEGQGQGLQFNFLRATSEEDFKDSLIIFVDSKNYDPANKYTGFVSQYSKKAIKREVIKVWRGVTSIKDSIEQDIPVFIEGRSSIHRDQILRFLVNWLACSHAKRDMIYLAKDKRLAIELRCLVRQFQEERAIRIFSMLECYQNFRDKTRFPNIPAILDWIKNDYIL